MFKTNPVYGMIVELGEILNKPSPVNQSKRSVMNDNIGWAKPDDIDYKELPVEVLKLIHCCNFIRSSVSIDGHDFFELLGRIVSDSFDYLNPHLVIDYRSHIDLLHSYSHNAVSFSVNEKIWKDDTKNNVYELLCWSWGNRDRLIAEHQLKLEEADDATWEPDGTLGNSEEHAVVATDVDDKAIDDALDLISVTIRLPKDLSESLTLLAKFGGTIQQALIRDILTKAVEDYKNKIL